MKKILVTGGSGLVGSAILRLGKKYTNYEFISTTHKEVDLTDEEEVNKLFSLVSPDYVIHTAARVGGIGRNLNSPAQQYRDNILMNTHVIHSSYKSGVDKLIAFGSVCSFPGDALSITEDILHHGEPYKAHKSYAYTKRMIDIQIEAYNSQYGTNYCSIIPGNIFGENDNFNLEDGHVIPSLIHKCFMAKRDGTEFEVWGTGKARREFLYAEDVARVCLDLLDVDKIPTKLIVSGEREFSIKEMAEKIASIFKYTIIKWRPDKPEGQLSRPSDKTLFSSVLPSFSFTDVNEALEKTIQWFYNNYTEIRK